MATKDCTISLDVDDVEFDSQGRAVIEDQMAVAYIQDAITNYGGLTLLAGVTNNGCKNKRCTNNGCVAAS